MSWFTASVDDKIAHASSDAIKLADSEKQLQLEVAKLKGENNRLKEDVIEGLEEKIAALEAQRDSASKGGADAVSKVKSLEDSLAKATKELKDAHTALSNTKGELEMKNGILNDLQENLTGAINTKGEQENDIKLLEGKIRACNIMLEEERNKVKAAEKRASDVEKEKASLAPDTERLKAKVAEFEKKEASNMARLNEAIKRENLMARERDEKMNQADHEIEKANAAEQQLTRMMLKVQEADDRTSEEAALRAAAEEELAKGKELLKEMKKNMKSYVEKQKSETEGMKKERDDALQKNVNLEGYSKRVKELGTELELEKARGDNAELRVKQLLEKEIKKEQDLKKEREEAADNKAKRITAKNEIMGLLKTLDQEREIASKVSDAMKYNLIPKAQKQYKDIESATASLNADLSKLVKRLGSKQKLGDVGEFSKSASEKKSTLGLMLKNQNLSDLDTEMERITAGLTLLCSNVERFSFIVDEEGGGSCLDSILNIVMGGSGGGGDGGVGGGGGGGSGIMVGGKSFSAGKKGYGKLGDDGQGGDEEGGLEMKGKKDDDDDF